MTARSVLLNDVRTVYDDIGDGEPALLCIHGWCSDRHSFDPFLPFAARERRVLSVDLRGHGDSGAGAVDFGRPEMVDSVEAVLAKAGARRVVPVTLSHGGWVAHDLHVRNPALVPGIVLVNWLVFPPPAGFSASIRELLDPERWQEGRRKLNEGWLSKAPREVVEREMAVKERYGYEMYARAAREISGAYQSHGSPLDAFARLASPPRVLFLHGNLGSDVLQETLDAYAQRHPWFTARPLRAGTYIPTYDAPAETAEIVEAFVQTL